MPALGIPRTMVPVGLAMLAAWTTVPTAGITRTVLEGPRLLPWTAAFLATVPTVVPTGASAPIVPALSPAVILPEMFLFRRRRLVMVGGAMLLGSSAS